jgi:phage terminase large subunit-like protein
VTTITGKPLSQRLYVDLNPTTSQHWTYKLWVKGIDPESGLAIDTSQYGNVVVNPLDNAANLSADYLKDLESLPPAARKRFFDGEYGADAEDALWQRATIRRVSEPPELIRVVVAIDPAATSEPGSDETGIVVAGIDAHRNGYVLEDASGRFRPEEWSRAALGCLDHHKGDLIVAEINNGGEMVESTIRALRPSAPYLGVRATRGKVIRAEPVSTLYHRGKVFHVGEFPALEDQMCSFTTGFDRKAAGYSPDRVDALVWAMTELFPDMTSTPVDASRFMGSRSARGWAAR